MKIISLVVGCCLLLCIVSSVQATELEPSTIQIYLTGGDTKNVTINVTGVETIYLGHEILPDSVGINVTYPLSINPRETKFFNMTINVSLNIAPDNYTIILRYFYVQQIPDESENGDKRDTWYPFIFPDYDEDDTAYPIIHPKPDKPNVIFRFSSDDEPQNIGCFLFLNVGMLAAIIIVLYLLVRKRTKAEKPGSEKNENKNK